MSTYVSFRLLKKACFSPAESASLLYMSRNDEKLIDIELLDCYNSLFVLSQTADEIMIFKLPGYNYRTQKGYKYTVNSNDKAVSLAVSEKAVCVALSGDTLTIQAGFELSKIFEFLKTLETRIWHKIVNSDCCYLH